MRARLLAIGALATATVAGGIGLVRFVEARSTQPETQFGALDYQSVGWQAEDVTVTSNEFEPISGLTNLEICNPVRAASALISMEVASEPINVRVIILNSRGEQLKELKPESVTMEPGTDSFLFVQPAFRWPSKAFVTVEGRVMTGKEATIASGALSVHYGRSEEGPC